MAQGKAKSRIFEAVHETASDLNRLCLIDKRKMRKFDALCLESVKAQSFRNINDNLNNFEGS